MNIFPKPAEELLVKAARELHEKRAQVFCIQFHLSQLKLQHKNADIIPALNILRKIVEEIEGGMYVCSDTDIFVILKTSRQSVIKQAISDLRFYYADDPLACGTEEKGAEAFATVYDAVKDYENFFFACNRKLVTLKENEANKQKDHLEKELKKVKINKWKATLESRLYRDELCILIVEDQVFSRQLLKESLAKNYHTFAAKDGTQAIELYLANAPDIVFLDIELPDYDGHQVLKKLLKFDPKAYVVMTTANNSVQDVKLAITEGACGYIIKPFTHQKIDQYIQMYVTKFKFN